MRISSREIQLVGLNSMLEQQDKLSKTQQQVASGNRVLTPSDDPVATTQILKLQQAVDTTQRYQDNAGAARDRLGLEESVLQGVTNSLQRVRELVVKANDGVHTDETRSYIAAEIRQRLDELLGLANTKDGNGDYLFAGGKGATVPFACSSGSYQYYGDQSERFIQIGSGRQVADGDSGADVFGLIRTGNGTFVTDASGTNTGTGVIDAGTVNGGFVPSPPNGYMITIGAGSTYTVTDSNANVVTGPTGYVSGDPIEFNGARVTITGTPSAGDTFSVSSSGYQNVFETLDKLATALETPASSPVGKAQLENALTQGLSNIDQSMTNVLVVRSSVGTRLNAIDSQQTVNDDERLQTKDVLSSLQDLDYADAVTRLNLQMAGLDAAQKAYMKVQGLSMFNYLSM